MYRFFILALFAAASAEVLYEGPCPPVKPMENFDFSAYQGTWYEIARYPNAGEEGAKGKCTTGEYVVNGNSGTVKNTHVVDGVKYYINGATTLVEPAKIKFTYTFGGRSKDSFFTVLKTDYKNYSIGYSCKYSAEQNTHQVFAWVMSRNPAMDPNSAETVNHYIQVSPLLDSDKYIRNDHSVETCAATRVHEITDFLD